MSNFAKRAVARESIENEVVIGDLIESPEDMVESQLEDAQTDTAEIDGMDAEGDVLEEDTASSEAALEIVEEDEEDGEELDEDTATAIDIAQESIRRRWVISGQTIARESASGHRSRRVVARESIVSTVKELIKRFIEWLKEMGRKVKDRWIKFSNAGKSIQSRSKKFDGAIKNLGAKNKDTVAGAFVKQLSIGATFEGNNATVLNNCIAYVTGESLKMQTALYEAAAVTVDASLSAAEKVVATESTKKSRKEAAADAIANAPAPAAAAKEAGAAAEKPAEVKGDTSYHMGGKITKESTDEDGVLKLELTEDDRDQTPADIPTPSVAQLNSTNDTYNKFGKELEKMLIGYRKTDSAREKLVTVMNKVTKSIDKFESADGNGTDAAGVAKEARKVASEASAMAGVMERLASHYTNVLSRGLGGYIQAGIGAYAKK